MIAETKNYYIELFTKKSIILSPPSRNPKERPKSHFRALMGINQIQYYLGELLEDKNVKGILKLGRLNFAREQLKFAKERWRIFQKSQVTKLDEPVGIFADNINKYSAKCLVLERESRAINKLLAQAKQAEKLKAEKEIAARKNRHYGNSGRLSFGKLIEWAGRPVHQDKNGVDIFTDDKTLVSDFQDAQNKIQSDRLEKEAEEDRQAAEQKAAMA